MEVGQSYHGFKLLEEKRINEAQALGRIFEHEKTKARLLHLENDDDNKVFGVGFRTPSQNSTGVAHIVEHCVLNGSRKYTTKEPFMDLIKGSLQTFLNAMTFSDKTIYPVASRNDKDFENLMDVYLDAVFHPAIYTTKEIFLQEGWHYHIEKEEDALEYKGVVYNEMKGALSGAEEQVSDQIDQSLFPDTIYGYESGGDPYVIPELTYEAFLDFHSKYYHPSNAYFFIYGDGDILKYLSHIDGEYLSHYDHLDVDSSISLQAPFPEKKTVYREYSVSPDDDIENKDYLSYNVMLGTRKDMIDLLAEEILSDVLIDSQSAPLKNALLKADIAEDIYSQSKDGLQIPFSIVAKNADKDRLPEFVEIIETTLKDLIAQGIDKKLLISSLNKTEYRYRETGSYSTQGILHYIHAFESWLYDGSPFDALEYDRIFRTLREKIDSDFFETYLQERVLDNPHKTILVSSPKPGMNSDRDRDIAQHLADMKGSLSPEALQELIAETKTLLQRQNSSDTPEQRATIPKLSLADVSTDIPSFPRAVSTFEEVTILSHDLFTSGITYMELLFDISHLSPEDIPLMTLLCEAIGAMDTENYTYSELDTEEYLATGGIFFTPTVYRDFREKDQLYPKLAISGKAIGTDNFKRLLELIFEMMTRTDFSSKKRFKEICQMLKSRTESGIYSQGHLVTVSRAASYFSPYHKYQESIKGLDFLFFLQDLVKNFDEKYEETLQRIRDLYLRLFTKEGLLVNLTAGGEDLEKAQALVEDFIPSLPAVSFKKSPLQFDLAKNNEGIQSASNVQYVAQAYDISFGEGTYSGEMEVLASVLSHEYLYNNIRAKGGAYGAGIQFGSSGTTILFSYRDPQLVRTLGIYKNIGDYLETLDLSPEDFNAYIIGATRKFNPALTSLSKGRLDMTMYITGQKTEDIQRAQEEALSTTMDRLKDYAPLLREASETNYICVLGNSEVIKENKDIFNNIIKLEN